ncbi:COG3931 Predicted N-formylglutamate amidohydrolase [Rhabdaerophilaceae bacterium]
MIASEQAEAFEIIGGDNRHGLIILCDHASSLIPVEFDNLGLPPAELARHIAYDIGAEAVSRTLARHFGCPAVLSRFSRLLIDPNRGEDDPTLVMRIADGAIVPGNTRISMTEINHRITRFYRPYDDAIARTISAMRAGGVTPVILAVHSFTPEMKGTQRPWHVTVIWDFDPRLNCALLRSLEQDRTLIVGENEPYRGGYRGDTLDRHVMHAGLAHALVEIRQDLIATPGDAESWGERLGHHLAPLLSLPDIRVARVYGAHP